MKSFKTFITETPWVNSAELDADFKRGKAKNGYYYKNEGEDVGSISAVVPNANHIKEIK